jgi:erythronate-4-phosphate dehydrogenase
LVLKKIKIIADDKIPFLKGVLEPFTDIQYLPPLEITKDIIKNADALLVRTRTKCDINLLENSSVKFIGTATIGFDHIDKVYCESKGIKWINAPGCNSSSVKQYIASALITIASTKKIKLGEMTIGVVGVGNVGSKVDKIAKIFGMNILLNDPPRERIEKNGEFVSLDYLVEKSDIITFHVPLNLDGTDKTFHLADKSFFQKFSNGKIFINTSRGEVVETNALKEAIRDKKISACVLDVWENEPLIDRELLNEVDIATPHIAGYSVEGKANGTSTCVNILNDFFNLGLKPNWYPEHLPSPRRAKEIMIDCKGKSTQEVIFDCIISTYDIAEDDIKLRNSVSDFERQRAEYPVRREFNYYDVHLCNADGLISSVISELGFNLKIN